MDGSHTSVRRLLPREHGLTAIWLSSTLAGLLSVKEHSDGIRFVSAVCFSVIILIASSSISRSLGLSIRVRSSIPMLLATSFALTLLTPLNNYIAAGMFPSRGGAAWLLLATYTPLATLSARRMVRQILYNRSCRSDLFLTVGGTLILSAMCSLLVGFALLPYSALLSIFVFPSLSFIKLGVSAPRGAAIRRIGFTHLTGILVYSIIVSAF